MTLSKDSTLAAILSALMPGLGQLYCQQWARGAMFLGGALLLAILAPPAGVFLSMGIWIWSIVDAYRIARSLRRYDQTGERPVIDVGRLRWPRVGLRPAIPYIVIPLGIAATLVMVVSLVLTRYGFWDAATNQEAVKALAAKIENYKAETGSYPVSLKAVIDPTDPIEKKWILDQWGNEYIYHSTPGGFEISSAGEDGRAKTKDDIRLHP